MDPESGYDRIANVGIDGGSVTAISEATLKGKTTVDATNLVVSPGWIDILSYEPNTYGIWFKIADGVTTNLGLHGLQARRRLLRNLGLRREPSADELRRCVQ